MTATAPRPLASLSISPASGEPPRSIVLLLHGYGSNGADLISFAQQWRRALPDTLFVAPNAPEPCHGAPGGYQWWALHDLSRASLGAGAARAAPVVNGVIDTLLETHGLGPERLLLLGFSQGTMLALHVALRRESAIAGVIGYSGMLTGIATLAHDIRARPPMLLVHGEQDPVVPFAAMGEAERELRRHGVEVASHASPGLGHSVDATGLKLGERFARSRLYE